MNTSSPVPGSSGQSFPRPATVPDERDQQIVDQRMKAFNRVSGPRIGDLVRFRDGIWQRITEIARDPDKPDHGLFLTGTGRWYLGEGFMSHSGKGFHPACALSSLERTRWTRPVPVWIFHHDLRRAHYDVGFTVLVKAFNCPLVAPH